MTFASVVGTSPVFRLRESKNIERVLYYHENDKRDNFISYSLFF